MVVDNETQVISNNRGCANHHDKAIVQTVTELVEKKSMRNIKNPSTLSGSKKIMRANNTIVEEIRHHFG